MTTHSIPEPTIPLTQGQRDFLGEYYREYATPESGPAMRLARASGFTHDHFRYLYPSYIDSWGGDVSSWDGYLPPPREVPISLPFTPEELAEILRAWAEYAEQRRRS